ncbi:hypothetical protein E2562_011293 [Oryza meyeriana var. granulata]|uniref:Uncharacterized protein n=1 Tax=Oryza meyeriana var. granulata TaxID=110450 RepID=A0A6G1BVU8_9ORYZ|nr:hypothetical protein E2562_011293 [Oryza meyeriana var. granulata]
MATSGDVEEVPEPGTDHPADLAPTTEEISRPVATETTSDHHEAAHPEQSAERSTSELAAEEEEKVPAAADTTSDHCEAAVTPKHATGSSTTSEQEEEEKVPAVPLPVATEQEAAEDDGQESARERLKRHRREMAGRVWVPDMWGQEKLLKDWVDCAVFDRPLVPPDLLTARRALVAECCARRPDRTPPASSSPLRVQNSCS